MISKKSAAIPVNTRRVALLPTYTKYSNVFKLIEFERCIDFLVRMIDKYGAEVLRELEEENRIRKKKKRQFPEIQNVNQTVAFSCIFKSNKF